ncbi:MAG TPA: DUF92 domain-containing protein [Candidatus Angelobacter sp.]|nr:DUF92 domain-containing protein [Candidatus Angelobacter sp.]
MRYSRILVARVRRQGDGWKIKLRRVHKSSADLISLLFGAAIACLALLRHANGPAAQKRRLLLAFGITTAFALVAWLAHGVNGSGALAGSAIAFVLAAQDLRMFWLLLLVFALTFAATHAGRSRKRELRIAEASDGRSAAQVMANLGIAGLILAFAPQNWALLGIAVLAEAAADTSSSEIGMAFPGRTVLLGSWRPVDPGVDGGVSIKGTAAAVVAASIVASAAVALKLVSASFALPLIGAGVLGSLVDSLIGALLEQRGLLTNDTVNLLSTAAAVGIMLLII